VHTEGGRRVGPAPLRAGVKRAREREGERWKKMESVRASERECVCVCERERESEREGKRRRRQHAGTVVFFADFSSFLLSVLSPSLVCFCCSVVETVLSHTLFDIVYFPGKRLMTVRCTQQHGKTNT
jgi:hypothetical protein